MRPFPMLLLSLALLSSAHAASGPDPDADYDRLDGKGASGKKVNVIEWEGNLEIHVYPAGSLKGLALKIDKPSKDKKVMVIGYRFDSDPGKTLVRRAILGIDLREGFKVYRDPSAGEEYDKIVISNNGLAAPLAAFKLDPEPKQLYPDGHPALAAKPDDAKAGAKTREPAREKAPAKAEAPATDEEGTIKPFQW